MSTNTLRIVAAAIAVLLLSNTAEARRYRVQPQQAFQPIFDKAAQPAYPLEAAQVVRHHARRHYKVRRHVDANGNRATRRHRSDAMLIDKPQQYVKPSHPGEKLVTREAHERPAGLLANGMIRVKTAQGFYITVNPIDAHKFLKFFALLKEHGYKVNPAIVGCYAAGGHKRGSNHHIGRACDNQTGWNRAPAYMYHVGNLIRQAGLFDGCSFGDCGHVEAVRGLYNKRPNLYAALAEFKKHQAGATAEVAEKPAEVKLASTETVEVSVRLKQHVKKHRHVRRHHVRRHHAKRYYRHYRHYRHYRRYARR